jgi:hypothetical protein
VSDVTGRYVGAQLAPPGSPHHDGVRRRPRRSRSLTRRFWTIALTSSKRSAPPSEFA